ncbi:MAG: cytochrome b [Hyphomonadaceae bacterium]|nr:cytochrome b [Hyphomonadaceae bacterium]
MTNQATSQKYTTAAIAIHWVVLFLVVAAYACILLRENFPRGSDIREALKAWHYSLGLSILGITALRLALRTFVWKTPTISPPLPPWLSIPAAAAHISLYLLLLAMPLAGWLILSAEAEPIRFWGLQLPSLIGADEKLAEQIQEIHETGGTIGYFLIGLHAAAALFHHFAVKDDTLKRMLPGVRRG